MMPTHIRWKSAWFDAKWALGFFVFVSTVTAAFELFDPVRPVWPLLAMIAFAALSVAGVVYYRYRNGPYYYPCGPFTIAVMRDKDYIPPDKIMATVGELRRRWENSPDTKADPMAVWEGYTIVLATRVHGPAGMHFKRTRRIILRKDHHDNAATLTWELGHALMYAELNFMPPYGRAEVGNPAKESRAVYEEKWKIWRKERDLL